MSKVHHLFMRLLSNKSMYGTQNSISVVDFYERIAKDIKFRPFRTLLITWVGLISFLFHPFYTTPSILLCHRLSYLLFWAVQSEGLQVPHCQFL